MTDYDWRKVEAQLNALPMFVTEIDGLDIHFIHIRSPHEEAMPMIMTHGWPCSILKVLRPLADPTAHGGKAEDAFHLVVPSIPGFGFSGNPEKTGWGSGHIGRVWADLMRRLGYVRYVSQSTSAKPTTVVISRPGNSHSYLSRKSAPHSGLCADRPTA
jgi:pimeloyl-ACP methyl ester carboxylesterase